MEDSRRSPSRPPAPETPRPHGDGAAEILAQCPVFDLLPGEPHFEASFPDVELLTVEEGFVVVRATPPGIARSIVTSEVGAGGILLRPAPEEALFGVVPSRAIGITAEARDRLLRAPAAAAMLVEELASTLSHKQEALGNFAHTRHVERVRRKLLQLAERYGHVARDGIRIDFPVSHTLLAEMTGSSRETVTRSLDELRRAGFVDRNGHSYWLLVSPESVAGGM